MTVSYAWFLIPNTKLKLVGVTPYTLKKKEPERNVEKNDKTINRLLHSLENYL